MNILDRINSPADLKNIPEKLLPALSREIRTFLIESVSQTGGHIAPSLGVVELTIALHYIFSTPKDKFIWDVGHQAYTHKLLTGRRDQFHTLRQFGGISGFPHITESIHDAMTVGHASTSISSAYGMACGRDMRNESGEVISIIGDGAMTGGLAYEGLNNLGHSNTRMVVILNDNEMSISPNVGGMSNYLTRILTDRHYTRLKDNVWNALEQFPAGLGKRLQNLGHTVDDSLKKALTPGKLFEDMGLTYLGPIDGHNFSDLLQVLRFARDDNKGPLLIHTITKKGKGYTHAEENATKFHGIGSFDIQSGELRAGRSDLPSWSKVFGNALCEYAEKDSTITAITAAMPAGTGLDTFQKKFPDQFYDVGIAEQHGTTFSAGLALRGLKPVYALYSSFMQRAFDQIIHDVALENLDVVFCVDRAGIVGADGPTHHGAFDLSYLTVIPNLTILAPSTGDELRQMLYSALYDISGPVVIRYARGKVPAQPQITPRTGITAFAPVCLREKPRAQGLIVSVGNMGTTAQDVHTLAEKDGIALDIVDMRTIKPLNSNLWQTYFSRYDRIYVLENNATINGAGAQLMQVAARLYAQQSLSRMPRIHIFGYPDRFIEQGAVPELMKDLKLTAGDIYSRLRISQA
ncbi:MAG: 1-deoxy-D-xylulose-5-phosphate synthase [Fibrobacterota bacterium]